MVARDKFLQMLLHRLMNERKVLHTDLHEGVKMRVRTVVVDDLNEVCKMLELFHAESAFKDIPFSAAELMMFLSSCVSKPEIFLRLAENGNVICGVMLAYRAKYFFSKHAGAWEELVYVKPEFRGQSTSRRLIKAYVEWARLAGVVRVNLGTSAGINTDRVVAFYEKLGFSTVGATLSMKLNRP